MFKPCWRCFQPKATDGLFSAYWLETCWNINNYISGILSPLLILRCIQFFSAGFYCFKSLHMLTVFFHGAWSMILSKDQYKCQWCYPSIGHQRSSRVSNYHVIIHIIKLRMRTDISVYLSNSMHKLCRIIY